MSNNCLGDGEYKSHQDKSTEATPMAPIRMSLAKGQIL